ncbi:MAG: pyruvate carboxylase [Solirubrobacteraceae bacterium]|nr:pyruvate carboxylase [Solirubrobacteraceae bacterium]
MIRKVLIGNRGEIAIRIARAANELGIRSVGVYAPEDRGSVHRLKTDEAYEIGVTGHPVRSYLDPHAMVELAVRTGADALHPGYGFLSENPALARACDAAGVKFVGPPADVLRLAGDKTRAREAAQAAGLPILPATDSIEEGDDARAAELAEEIGYPLFVKASQGGGGRGMRLVKDAAALASALADARREAAAAFGSGTLYLERAMISPRHVEVQLIADERGSVIHLWDRDCSVQRRHQKVIEIAPAPALDAALRERLHRDAVALGRSIGYVNAGTVEFLVEPSTGDYAFIEMNPRVQVEHTITEEVTDVDVVRTQLLVAGGATLEGLGLSQEEIRPRGCALQCRITTEDPSNGFRPDTGKITAYRAPGGAGIRLDEGSAYVGAEVLPYFDPLLTKVSARGADLHSAAARARRAVQEFRVRGVRTNQAFLLAVLEDEDFLAGRASTSFVDERPHLVAAPPGGDRASRLLRHLADRTVNRTAPPGPPAPAPAEKLPPLPPGPAPAGSRERLRELGPIRFAAELRAQRALAITDTTLRDAHQSLFATRMRTYDMLRVAPHLARMQPQTLSFEVWGGATFDVALRFLQEDPWDRLASLREAIPNVCLQMLVRGGNLLAYSRFPDRVVRAFVEEAGAMGIDVFRVFDALNDVDGMLPCIEAGLERGNVLVEGTLCYTGDLCDPSERLYDLSYYLRIAERLVASGVHVLAVKDMAGLLRAPAARVLIGALRREFDLPVHLHTHDTAGGQMATYMAAIEAGVDAVDGAAAPLAGGTSQPSLSAIVAATAGTEIDSGIELDALLELEPYWEATRRQYAPWDAGRSAPTGRVYRHEIPGGQLTNLREQAVALGLGDRFEEIEHAYEQADRLLGRIVKVTPSSKVVGDLAIFAVSTGTDLETAAEQPAGLDVPSSVLGFLRGELGRPAAGFPEPLTSRVLASAPAPAEPRTSGASPDPGTPGKGRRGALSSILFPGPAADFEKALDDNGDVSVIPTRAFFHGLEDATEVIVDLDPGVRLVFGLEAVGELDARGHRTVLARVNGQLRPVEVRDLAADAVAPDVERADPLQPGHVAAPVTGVVNLLVGQSEVVEVGQPLAVMEAMKMESTVTAPVAGVVRRLPVQSGQRLEHGDLLLELAVSPTLSVPGTKAEAQ